MHFFDYTATSSCNFLESDLGEYKALWWCSLIGFIAGKFPGYLSISKFVNFAWKSVAVNKGPGCSMHKRAKLASHPGSPEVSSSSPQVVHVSEVAAASPPRRPYLTRSKAASAIRRLGVPLGRSGRPSKTSSLADSKIQGSTPSSSL
ncbi:hypothetical protein Peur_039369 [Populus x canadensis]